MSETLLAPASTVLLLIGSNIFMTFAWYGHLRYLENRPWLCVFAPFALVVMKQPLKLDFLWAGLCMVAAVYVVFRAS